MRIYPVLAIIVVLGVPMTLRAEENEGIKILGSSIGIEFNALETGSSAIFSTKDKHSDSGREPESTVEPADIHASFLRSYAEFRAELGNIAEFWIRPHTESD